MHFFIKVAKKGVLFFAVLLLSISHPVEPSLAALVVNASLSVSGNYSDNLFFTQQDKKSDFSTAVSPVLNFDYTSRNVLLNVGYSGSAVFYSQNPQADGYYQSLSFDIDLPGLNHQIRGLEVRMIEKVSYSPGLSAYSFGNPSLAVDERLNQVLLEGEGIQGERVDTFRNRAGIELAYSWTQNYKTMASYQYIITRYSGNKVKDTNVSIASIDGNHSYRVSSRTGWTVGYGVSASFGDKGDDLIYPVSVGVEHQVTRLVSVNGQLGVSFVEGESPDMILRAKISKQYQKGTIDLQYIRNVVAGYGVIQRVVRRQSIVGEATRSLGALTAVYLQLAYAQNESFEVNQIDVSSYAVETGVSTQFLSWLTGSLSYSYLDQSAQGTFAESTARNSVNVMLTASAPSWRIMK